MKKMFALALMLVMMPLMFSGCSRTNAESVDQTDRQPPVQSDKPIEPPEPPETAPPPEEPEDEPMTYDKYFGEELVWVTSSVGIAPDIDEISFRYAPGYGNSRLAKSYDRRNDCYNLIPNGETVYTPNGKDLYMTSERGAKSTLIYSGENISRPRSDGTALFFVEGDMVRRLFLPDGRVEDIYPILSDGNGDSFYQVHSNYVISWYHFNPEEYRVRAERQGQTLEEFLQNPNMTLGRTKVYNSMTGEFLKDWSAYNVLT